MSNKELTTSYSKGEWYLQKYTDAYTNIVRCNNGMGHETLYIASTTQNTSPETRANARLMAAAPDLLESLQEIISITDRDHIAWDRAKAAIKKATVNHDLKSITMSNNTQLPAEYHAEAQVKAKEYRPLTDGNPLEVGKRHGFYDGYIACSSKLHAVENALTAYKKEYQVNSDLLDKAIDILEKVKSRHEGGLLPDRLLYNEIKTFLDGKK